MSSSEDALKKRQCDHIRSNLSSLIKLTTLDAVTVAIFIERNILGSEDEDKLKAIQSQHERNREFYSIIQTRVGFYEVLLDAMERTCQTGVLELLRKLHPVDSAHQGTRYKHKNYSCLPTGLHELISEVSKPLCVVLNTPDVNITIAKIHEFLEGPQEFHRNNKYFRRHISTLTPSKSNLHIVHIVRVLGFEELKHMLQDSLLQIIVRKKLIVVLVAELNQEHHHWLADYAVNNPSQCQILEITNDNLEWAGLSPAHQQEIAAKVKTKFNLDDQDELDTLLHGEVLAKLIRDKEIKLFKKTIPNQLDYYYAKRTMLTRNIISHDVFGIGKEEPHTFLFTRWDESAQAGMSRSELSGLVKNSMTGGTREQLAQQKITVKFMVLDKPDHFDKICKRLEKSNESVHLLHLDSDKRLIWKKSHGKLDGLHRFIDKVQDRMSDVAFLQRLMQNSNLPVLISDSPGMGKTVLLGRIGWELATLLCPEREVFLLNIVQFIRKIKELIKEDDSPNEVAVMTALQHLVCENDLGRAILKRKLLSKDDVLVELLLDGLDELEKTYHELAFDVLKVIIASFESIGLCVASRPHLHADLANTLKVLGYKTEPFNDDDQVKFLTEFWSWSQPKYNLSPDKLNVFATKCLAKIKSGFNSTIGQDLAGVLFQCHLIGELYEEEALEYSEIGRSSATNGEFKPLKVRSIIELFETAIDQKMSRYESQNNERKLERNVNMNCHARAALQFLFSENFKSLATLITEAGEGREELLTVGILEAYSATDVPWFTHLGFAEYCIAWFVVEQFKVKLAWFEKLKLTVMSRVTPKKLLLDFFLPDILKCEEIKINLITRTRLLGSSAKETISFKFIHNTIAYFIDSLLMDKDIQGIATRFRNYFRRSHTSQKRLMEIAHACANSDYLQIFKFLDAADVFDEYARSIFDNDFILLSVEFSSVEFVEISLNHFERHYDFAEIKIVALQTAIQRGDFSMVEFFLNVRGLRTTVAMRGFLANNPDVRLIHDCIASSNAHSENKIEQRIIIIERLIKINRSLLEEKNILLCTPLLRPDIHFSIMRRLIELGADVSATDHAHDTILHLSNSTGRRISSSDYDQLLRIIPDDNLHLMINQYGNEMDTPPVRVLKYHDPSPATLDKFNDLGFNFNTDKYSILWIAIRAGRSSATIQKLIDIGASLDWKNDQRQTLLHLAVESGNTDVIKILAENIDVNSADKDGLTPLDNVLRSHHFTGRVEMGKAIHAKGGVFTAVVNSHDQTLLHIASLEGNLDAVRLLVDFGVDVNVQDRKGNTPLHVGVLPDTVALLFQKQADISLKNKQEQTPFHSALRNPKLTWETYELLKSRSTPISTPSPVSTPNQDWDWTPSPIWTPEMATDALKFALRPDHYIDDLELDSISRDSIKNKADVNIINAEGNALLHIVAQRQIDPLLHFAIEEGEADVNLQNRCGQTPLHITAVAPDKEASCKTIQFLIEYGANVNVKDQWNNTFLHSFLSQTDGNEPSPSQIHSIVDCLVSNNQHQVFDGQCQEILCKLSPLANLPLLDSLSATSRSNAKKIPVGKIHLPNLPSYYISRTLTNPYIYCISSNTYIYYLTEADLCSRLQSPPNMAVVISGSSGMGKSQLLANIGKTLRDMHADRNIILIPMTEFIELVKKTGNGEMDKSIEEALISFTCESETEKEEFKSSLQSFGVMIELLLDEFDKVKDDDLKLAYDIVQTIMSSSISIRMWITTRPHLLEVLENTLHVIGYIIVPFNKDEQVQLLTNYWSSTSHDLEPSPSLDQDRLKQFALHCLAPSSPPNLQLDDNDMTGNPLNALFIGEIHEKDANEYARGDFTQETTIDVTDIYKLLITRKLQDYNCASPGGTITEQELLEMHIGLSLNLLFPSHYNASQNMFSPIPLAEILKVGIMDPSHPNRGVAEYFVAWFLADRLQGVWSGTETSSDLSLMYHDVLKCKENEIGGNECDRREFTQPSICYFLNSLIDNLATIPSQLDQHLSSSEQVIRDICYSSANANFFNIFQIFSKTSTFSRIGGWVVDADFILLTVRKTTLDFVKLSLILFEQHHKFHLGLHIRILREAVQRGNLPIVEFLVKEKGLQILVQQFQEGTRSLLHNCVAESRDNSESQIEQKIQVIRMLVKNNPALLETTDGNGNTPLLSDNCHVELLIELIRLGANVLHKDKQNRTFLYKVVENSTPTPSQYHSLLVNLPREHISKLFRVSYWYDSATPLQLAVKFLEVEEATLSLLHSCEVDFNVIDRFGRSLLSYAIEGRRTPKLLTILINRCGADPKHLSHYKRCSVLHDAAKLGTVDAVEYFLQLDIVDVNGTDINGDTPIHRALASDDDGRDILAKCKLLIEHGADVGVKNKDGNLPLDLVLENYDSEAEFRNELIDIL